MKENPLIVKIDEVLYALRDNPEGLSFHNIFNKVYTKNNETELQNIELKAILGKLLKENYIEKFKPDLAIIDWHKITFDGLLFAYQGAYASVEWEKRRDWEMARESEKR